MMPLLLFALGLLASAFFSAVETAIVSVNRTRLSHRADSGDGGAARALRFLDDPRRLFGATLVGNNLANVFTATLATLWFAHRFGEGVVPWVVLGLTAVLLVVGEIVPKSIARAQADHLTVALTALLESFDAAMRPLVLVVTGASTALLRLFGVRTSPSRGAMSRQDFQLLLDESEETGQVAPGQGRILSNVLDFGETTVAQVMRPRTEIVSIEAGTPVREVIALVDRTGYTRIPAYRGSPDQIVGFVHLFDLLRTPALDLPVDGLLRPIGFVPEAKPCDELLREMRARHRPIMIVVDEYGGTAGIVTIEDLVEELVGDIKNEGESAATPVRRLDAGRWQVEATMRIFDVNEALELELPEGDYETLGGLVLERLGRIPAGGDFVTVGGVKLEVLAADRRRVRQVAITRPARTEDHVSEEPHPLHDFEPPRVGFWARMRSYFLAGLLVLGPTTITLYVLFRFLWLLDSLLGRYIKFPALVTTWLPEGRIPGLGIVAMFVLVMIAGFIASSLAGTGALAAWERVLTRLPLARIIYSATKGLGEAFLSGRRTAFRQVVLIEYPRPGVWVIGFRSADPPAEVSEKAGVRLVSVFVPNTPNPTSGYFRLVPETSVRPLDLTVEQAVKLVASAGVVQSPASPNPESNNAPHGPDPV